MTVTKDKCDFPRLIGVCYYFIGKKAGTHLAAIFSHLTIIFLNKLIVYGVVQQVYGVVTPDSVSKVLRSLDSSKYPLNILMNPPNIARYLVPTRFVH